METMTMRVFQAIKQAIIAQLRRDGNYDERAVNTGHTRDHSTTETGWKL